MDEELEEKLRRLITEYGYHEIFDALEEIGDPDEDDGDFDEGD